MCCFLCLFFLFSSCLIFVKKITTLNANNVFNIILIYDIFNNRTKKTSYIYTPYTLLHHTFTKRSFTLRTKHTMQKYFVQKYIKPNVSLNINCISFTNLFRLTSSFLAVKSLKFKFSLIPGSTIKIIKIKYVNKLNF